jgi:hypothetical protein
MGSSAFAGGRKSQMFMPQTSTPLLVTAQLSASQFRQTLWVIPSNRSSAIRLSPVRHGSLVPGP